MNGDSDVGSRPGMYVLATPPARRILSLFALDSKRNVSLTSVSEILVILLRADLRLLEVLVLDLGELDHFELCGLVWWDG